MIRKALWLSAATAVLAAFACAAHARRNASSTSTTGRTISTSSIIADFTKETGIKVVYDVFDSNEILETKLLAGGSGYDVVVPTGHFLARQIEAGVFQKLDKSKLPNLANMWDVVTERDRQIRSRQRILHQLHVGHHRHRLQLRRRCRKRSASTRSTAGTSSSIRRSSPSSQDCGVYVLDSPTDIIPTALNYLGLDPEATSPDDFAKAEEAAAEDPALHPQVPFVRIHQRAGQWRHLPGGRLVGRRLPGARPRRRGRPGRRRSTTSCRRKAPRCGSTRWPSRPTPSMSPRRMSS